ncbi:MAG: glycosyltransferase family 4 protein [Candidatus Woesearchaeota archaeon]
MKKIYFHLPFYPDWFDGLNKYQTKVFEYFKAKGLNVYAFGRTVQVRHSKYPILQKFYKIIHLFGIISGIFHILRIPRKSVIVITNASFFHYIIPLFFNRFYKQHYYFLVIHDLIQKERPTYFRKIFENYFIRNADKLVANSKTTKDDLLRLNLASSDIEVVYPGLDVDFYAIPRQKIFGQKAKLLYVGSIEKRKGIIYLIEALNSLRDSDFELHCIGNIKSPKYYSVLCDTINKYNLNNKIIFHGRIDTSELTNYFITSSIFVFPTLYEGYGMAVAEAMAYGLPVIASKIPAIEEFLENEKEGFLVEPRNSKKLSEALSTLMNNPLLMQLFSEKALEKARTFPSWDNSAEKILKNIEDISI